MYYELALISVLVAGGYWGWYFVRLPPTRLYGVLQIGAAALSGLGLLGEWLDEPSLGVPGAIGVGAGACFLVVGPVARALARRFAAAERFGTAGRLLDIAEVLAPGSGVGDEKALLGAMREIRDGNIEATVEALESAKRRAPDEARRPIDERIAMLYLASYRWDDAIAHAETHLFGGIPPTSTEPEGDAPAHAQLRAALGIAPPVWVELLGAYGYKGDLDQAARMLARLEEVCAGRPDAGLWLHRGRLIFLALAGRVGAVQTLVEPKRSRHMKPAARAYWLAVAHERQGEVAAAQAAYARARAGSRGRPRMLIDQALARLPTAQPLELGPTAAEIVARVEAEPPPVVLERAAPRGPIATRLLLAALIGVAVASAVLLGSSSDLGVLVRNGALVRWLVHDGEWWRVISNVFVHIGGLHLLVNVVGLWMLGRLSEDLLGPWRTITIFGLAGVAGAVASLLATPAGISAGASGGLFGLLGAVFAELTLHRRSYVTAWTRGVWGGIAVVTVAQLGIGFLYPVTDQWAHGAGLVTGAVLGFLLSPHARWTRIGHHAARVVAIAFGLAAAGAAALVIHTSIADSFDSAPRVRRATPTTSAIVPASWQRFGDELYDPDLFISLLAQRVPEPGPLAARFAAHAEGEPARARAKGFEQRGAATTPLVAVPDGWEAKELIVEAPSPIGDPQRFRVVVAARRAGSDVVLASLYTPETVARAAPGFLTALLASIE